MIEINEETIAEAARIHAQRDLILNSKGIAYALQCIELAEMVAGSIKTFEGYRIVIVSPKSRRTWKLIKAIEKKLIEIRSPKGKSDGN